MADGKVRKVSSAPHCLGCHGLSYGSLARFASLQLHIGLGVCSRRKPGCKRPYDCTTASGFDLMLPRGPHKELRTSDCGVLAWLDILSCSVQRYNGSPTWNNFDLAKRHRKRWIGRIRSHCNATGCFKQRRNKRSEDLLLCRLPVRAVDERLRSMHRMCSSF